MEREQIIVVALIVIVVALLVGVVAMMMPNMGKQDTILKFKSNSTLTQGDSIKVKLTDSNGTAIANQTVNVTITNKDGSDDYHTVVTNKKGVGTLKLDKNPGKYNITVSYGGNDKYNGCNVTKKIKIEEKVVETEVSSSQSSSNSQSSSDSQSASGNQYDINNLPPSNDPYQETNRYQLDENHVAQEYSDHYRSIVDLRTGERHGGWV